MAKALPSMPASSRPTPIAAEARRARVRRTCATSRTRPGPCVSIWPHSMRRMSQVTVPASISPTDPGARWTAVDGPAFYAYSTNYLIDVQAGIIVDVEATPTLRTAEVKATRTMIERVEERFDLKPERLIGDTAYGTAEILGWMVNDKEIEPHVPVWDKTQRDDGTLSSSDFLWDEQADEYRCPQGKALRRQ